MPLSMTAKAVLCLCPPAVMAGTVATVPAVKHAVHHLTAPHHAPTPVRHLAHATTRAQVDCDPVAPATLPAVPLVTYAAPIPDEPAGAEPAGGGVPGGVGTLATGGGVAPLVSSAPAASPAATTPAPTVPVVVTPTPTTTSIPVGAVPEPATWLLMIGGAGLVGAVLRRRRRGVSDLICTRRLGARAAIGTTLWSGGVAAEAGEMAATVAAKTTAAGVAGKALLCVCPAAVMAGSVMTVPPLRQAVHASTAAPVVPAAPPVARPCDAAATIPVSATSVNGFPATVDTASAKML